MASVEVVCGLGSSHYYQVAERLESGGRLVMAVTSPELVVGDVLRIRQVLTNVGRYDGVTSECLTVAELELEWQVIKDPETKSGLCAPFRAEYYKNLKDDGMVNTAVEGNFSRVGAITGGLQTSRLVLLSLSHLMRDAAHIKI